MTATAVTATATVTLVANGDAEISMIRSVRLYNVHTANTAAASVIVSSPGTATEYIVARFTQLTCQQSVESLEQPLVLNPYDTLKVACNPVHEVHVVASYLRID